MDKMLLKRLAALENMVTPTFRLLCTMPDGKRKTLTVDQYLQQPEPLDFKVSSGDSLTDAGAIFVYLLRCFYNGEALPQVDAGGSGAMAQYLNLANVLTNPQPNRNLSDFE